MKWQLLTCCCVAVLCFACGAVRKPELAVLDDASSGDSDSEVEADVGAATINDPSCLGSPCVNSDCCAVAAIPGDSFLLLYGAQPGDPLGYHARISGVRLGVYPVTVARYRKFVESYPASRPAVGSSAFRGLPGTGWTEPSTLPGTQAELRVALAGTCEDGSATWTDAPSDHEQLPMNCITWIEARAFCAWIGGRLPTFAELSLAGSAGHEQRLWPWSVPPDAGPIDLMHADYSDLGGTPPAGLFPRSVDAVLAGRSREGLYDLVGGVSEWTLDGCDPTPEDCDDCIAGSSLANCSVQYGGSFSTPPRTPGQRLNDVGTRVRNASSGVRCAFDL
jgi:sulfatase modifying factor 1